jgi:hypothetical protein
MEINPAEKKRSLDERFSAYPELCARMQKFADELDLDLAKGGSLDDVEDRIVPLLRQFGADLIAARATRIAQEVPAPAGVRAHIHSKKKSTG